MRMDRTNIAFSLLAAVMLAFIVLPIAKLVLTSDAVNLLAAMRDHEVTRSIWLTLTSAFWATALALVFGIPLAYLLARHEFRGKKILEGNHLRADPLSPL